MGGARRATCPRPSQRSWTLPELIPPVSALFTTARPTSWTGPSCAMLVYAQTTSRWVFRGLRGDARPAPFWRSAIRPRLPGATLTIIPEEISERPGFPARHDGRHASRAHQQTPGPMVPPNGVAVPGGLGRTPRSEELAGEWRVERDPSNNTLPPAENRFSAGNHHGRGVQASALKSLRHQSHDRVQRPSATSCAAPIPISVSTWSTTRPSGYAPAKYLPSEGGSGGDGHDPTRPKIQAHQVSDILESRDRPHAGAHGRCRYGVLQDSRRR